MITKFGTDYIESATLKVALRYLETNPDKNIPKLLYWWDKVDRDNNFTVQRRAIRDVIGKKDSNWYQLIKSLWTDINPDVRKRFFENLVVNSYIVGGRKQALAKDTLSCNIPWAILMDPTTACNLDCIGCWAAEYDSNRDLGYGVMNDIIRQGKEVGIYMYIFSGGEPLMRKDEIIHLCEAHPDCQFLAFTNGTLIDESFADEMLRIKNFIPAISVEGFEKQTDARRGEGTYEAVIQAMKLLKQKQLIFGVSCCYTSQNTESVGSEEFIDELIQNGAKFAWFFTYMPVGINAVPPLMANAGQRKYMYQQLRKFRKTKPIFTIDFWNDGEYVNGCIAGGRSYLHINANGDVEPCAFIHYSDSNIKELSLIDALKSPLFMEYYANQPFNENMLRPCPLLDNPEYLAEMITKSGAKSTDLQNPEDAVMLSKKCEKVARYWKPVADELWQSSSKNQIKE